MIRKETRPFPLRTVLSFTTKRLLVRDPAERELVRAVSWMTGYEVVNFATCQVLAGPCMDFLLGEFPELAIADEHIKTLESYLPPNRDSPSADDEAIDGWLASWLGGTFLKLSYDVPRMDEPPEIPGIIMVVIPVDPPELGSSPGG